MWLKINYQEEFEYEIFKPDAIYVSLIESQITPIKNEDKSIRVSKIFPLNQENKDEIDLKSCDIYFFDFDSPFRILGKIKQRSTRQFVQNVYFSYGSCSIILFAKNENVIDEFLSLDLGKANSSEKWTIKNNLIFKIEVEKSSNEKIDLAILHDYSNLPSSLITIIDEFAISIKILESKVSQKDTYNVGVLKNLVFIVNLFINELVYFHNPEGIAPQSIYQRNKEQLLEPLENQIQRQQIIDRLIQINSSLAYVSTQTYSGAIPILERRSLIRRNSLLGIGASIKALNRIVEYIENAFISVNFLEIITNMMSKSSQLNGLDSIVHYRTDWYKNNIDTFTCNIDTEENIKKLAYFSSRHAYRESEYSITASLNSVTHGLSLEWSLMTITHEMLHSHVRLILNSIFYEDTDSDYANYQYFFNRYSDKLDSKKINDYCLLDSVREIIFTYSIRSKVYGSLTQKKEYKTILYQQKGAGIYLLKFEDFYNTFQSEYRNLNEIFVHILDLHYFYQGRTTKYIPLIWSSWSAVPHINADIRQYILRSLLAIASKIDQDPFERWNIALKEFRTIISETPKLKDIPLITKVLQALDDHDTLNKFFFGAFKNSLIIVDLVMEIFYSKKISQSLWDDENIILKEDDNSSETNFSYNAPDDFMDIPISCPIPYLFDRMIKILQSNIDNDDVERCTTISILAINSK